MMGSNQHQEFCLRWRNHQLNMLSVFDNLLQNESFVDVTLACDGTSLKAHKVVLSACSPYFQKLLLDNPCQHPIIILKDVMYADLKLLVDFMYKGEVSVAEERLQELIKTADILKIKGLSEVSSSYNCETPTNFSSNTDKTAGIDEEIGSGTAAEELTATIIAIPCLNERPKSRVSPPSKRRRPQKLQCKSESIPDCDSDCMSLSQKIKVNKNSDEISQSENSSHNPNLRISNENSTSEQCGLDSKEVHNNSGNLDSSGLLGMDGFSADQLPSDQFPSSLETTLNGTLNDAIVDQKKNAIGGLLKLVECSSSPTSTASKTLCTASVATMTTSTQSDPCFLNDNERVNDSTNVGGLQWTNSNMNHTLEVVRQSQLSLSKSSAIYSIPTSNWTEDDLHQALDAVRTGRLSITKAAVTFGIPNSTLWQRSRREGIDTSRSGGNFHAAQWSEATLAQAIQAVRMGHMSISKASTTFGIPSTTLWSKAKRYGIETSRKLMSEQDREEFMWQALQAVKNGFMSMTQASIKFNVPYTTLWKNFKKWEINGIAPLLPHSSSSTSSTSSTAASTTPNMKSSPHSSPLHYHHLSQLHTSSHSASLGLGHHLAVSLHSLPQQLENMLPDNSCTTTMNT